MVPSLNTTRRMAKELLQQLLPDTPGGTGKPRPRGSPPPYTLLLHEGDISYARYVRVRLYGIPGSRTASYKSVSHPTQSLIGVLQPALHSFVCRHVADLRVGVVIDLLYAVARPKTVLARVCRTGVTARSGTTSCTRSSPWRRPCRTWPCPATTSATGPERGTCLAWRTAGGSAGCPLRGACPCRT